MPRRRFLAGCAGLALAGVLPGTPARAGGHEMAVVYDVGGKMDKSFNQAAFQGVLALRRAERARRIGEFEIAVPEERRAVLRRAAAAAEAVVVVGSGIAPAVTAVAADFPDHRFALIDGVAVGANIASIVFADYEAAFLAGVMAGLATRSGTTGFIGGKDIPPVRRFLAGFRQGLGQTRPDGRVIESMLGGSDVEAWSDPFNALLVGRQHIARGADVLFGVCGASGLGVHQAAADAGVFSIGVDSNQNYLHPGSVLTSAVKRVDQAVLHAAAMLEDDAWRPGRTELGLADDVVGVAFDAHNAAVADPMRPVVDEYRRRIVSGEIVVRAGVAAGAGRPAH